MFNEAFIDEIVSLANSMQEHPELYLRPDLKESLDNYVNNHIPLGSFLEACVSNNLKEALAYADPYNMVTIFAIVFYIYNYMPMNCQGSQGAYHSWIERSPK